MGVRQIRSEEALVVFFLFCFFFNWKHLYDKSINSPISHSLLVSLITFICVCDQTRWRASQWLVCRYNPNPLWVLKASFFIRNICLFVSPRIFVYHRCLPGCLVVSHTLSSSSSACMRAAEEGNTGVCVSWMLWLVVCVCVCVVGRQASPWCSSLCSRLIACFSQTQRLVLYPVTPWCECVYAYMWRRRGLKTGLVSSGSKPEQIDRINSRCTVSGQFGLTLKVI